MKMNLRDKLKEISYLPIESISEEYKLLLQESIDQNDIAVQFCCLKNIARIYNYMVCILYVILYIGRYKVCNIVYVKSIFNI